VNDHCENNPYFHHSLEVSCAKHGLCKLAESNSREQEVAALVAIQRYILLKEKAVFLLVSGNLP
jgi:hypothetical protein